MIFRILSHRVKSCRHLSSRVKSSQDLSKIRNVGIIAHIDAGKTTTTERMLFYAGFTSQPGEVHHGNTVMDYMEQERNRGITITSAAITFPWNKHQINLIDTPGHVDFTVEVERALRVLDGGVVILDGSAGVEAQTLTVWRQANHHKLPRIAFINKLDKANADFDMSLRSIKDKLHVQPLIVQAPMPNKAHGVLDIVNLEALQWDANNQGTSYTRSALDPNSNLGAEALTLRTKLIDQLCDLDETLADEVIETADYSKIGGDSLTRSLRKVTLTSDQGLVTFSGSAFKNYGVQPLMDGILRYLPSPQDIHFPFLRFYQDHFCGLAFKTVHHPHKGSLTFVRVYNGVLKEGDTVFNMTKDVSEKVSRLMVAFADDFKQVSQVTAGNIAVIHGLKTTSTGDTLVLSAQVAKSVMSAWEKSDQTVSPLLHGVDVPDPVFYCSVEPPSLREQKAFDHALENLCREDPSLRVSVDAETGQTVLSGMGELHLEIIKDRILKEYKVDAELGKLMISYRETPLESARKMHVFERAIGDDKFRIELDLQVQPTENSGKPILSLAKTRDAAENLMQIRPWQMKALNQGFQNAILSGPLLQYAIIDCNFFLYAVTISRRCPESLVASAMIEAVKDVLSESQTRLLEPFMRLTISCPDEPMAQNVANDLMKKRGFIEDIKTSRDVTYVHVVAPLAELRGYSSYIRKLTSGKANFGMEFSHYQSMDQSEQNKAIEEVTGFPPM